MALETISLEMSTTGTTSIADLPVLPGCRANLPRPDTAGLSSVAALLADPTRAGILALLHDGPACVCEMAAALGERQNNVSMHLARLREAGLVRAARHAADARWIYYERDDVACEAACAALQRLLK
jgi:ArsR family transcriptional regulator